MRVAAFLDGINSGMQTRRDRKERAEDRKPRSEIEGRRREPVDGDFKLDTTADAPSLIRDFEGYRDTPYWDVNAYRVGYGSDTVTRPDGSVVRTAKGMKITRADADRDLARRTQEFQTRAAAQAGGAWDRLTPQVTSALTSVAYNYGSLPDRILPQVRSGDPAAIAAAIEGLSGDNDGINKKRRAREAAIVRSGIRDPEKWASLRGLVAS